MRMIFPQIFCLLTMTALSAHNGDGKITDTPQSRDGSFTKVGNMLITSQTPSSNIGKLSIKFKKIPSALTACISGNLEYPGEGIPAYTITATNIHTGKYYSIETKVGANKYRITGMNEGDYTILAYPMFKGISDKDVAGYTVFHLCGQMPGCKDHRLLPIRILAGEEATFVNPTDIYYYDAEVPVDKVLPVDYELISKINSKMKKRK